MPVSLAYRLYAICERKGWAQEALAYNTLVTSWSHIQSATTSSGAAPLTTGFILIEVYQGSRMLGLSVGQAMCLLFNLVNPDPI